jgi:hypothetical protein
MPISPLGRAHFCTVSQLSVYLFTIIIAGWNGPQALIGATAFSTKSVALVYTVIIE